jgi:predicted  nucleic acid-binding Zn-ribbon protein
MKPLRSDVEALVALMALDEEVAAATHAAADSPPAGPKERRGPSAGLDARRSALTRRLPPEALEIYDDALRRGLRPAAVGTRGRVCWGCFHSLALEVATPLLSEEAFVGCPHCERLLFNPDWKARR